MIRPNKQQKCSVNVNGCNRGDSSVSRRGRLGGGSISGDVLAASGGKTQCQGQCHWHLSWATWYEQPSYGTGRTKTALAACKLQARSSKKENANHTGSQRPSSQDTRETAPEGLRQACEGQEEVSGCSRWMMCSQRHSNQGVITLSQMLFSWEITH